jgi:hypothetical protein
VTEKPAVSPTAFRFPNAPKPAVPARAKPVVRKKPATAPPASFALPGQKPLTAKKKNPATFRMPEKKAE